MEVTLRERMFGCSSMEEYLDLLPEIKKSCIVAMSVCDTPGSMMPEPVLQGLQALGFARLSKILWKMYAGVIGVQGIRLDCAVDKPEEPVVCRMNLGGAQGLLELSSQAWRRGNCASIKVSGIELALNQRGLNIVVYDEKEGRLIDSVCYDSHEVQERFEHIGMERLKKTNQKLDWLRTGNRYDVCVAGFWYGTNYGSLLNGYATYTMLREKGQKVLMLNKLGTLDSDLELRPDNHNMKFCQKYYPLEARSPYFSYEELPLLNDFVQCFCAGSDQIWNYPVSFDEMMYLPFVAKNKWKISFASSFGSADDHIPDDKRENIKRYLSSFDAISVREDFDREILRKKFSLDSTVLLEPAFFLSQAEYIKMAGDSDVTVQEPYIVAYILDPTDEKRDFLLQVGHRLDRKVVTISDGYFGNIPCSWDEYPSKESFPNLHVRASVQDFLALICHADFVVTDSFHGTTFSMIFEKKFIALSNPIRGKERFYYLLGRFGLMDRLLDQEKLVWNDQFLGTIDYVRIAKEIAEEKAKAFVWLNRALVVGKDSSKGDKDGNLLVEKLAAMSFDIGAYTLTNPVALKLEKRLCMGCGACVSVCPTGALSLQPDEYGYYRSRLEAAKCIDCNKCTNVCPAFQLPEKGNSSNPSCYEFVAEDRETLQRSSSGGIFSVLAKDAFRRGGVVAGAAWKDDFSVEHVFIDSEEDLSKLRKSKYLQSYMGDSIKRVKTYLDEGRFVLFSGCPCQVAGLKKYLGKEYENLLTVDLLCGNAPSTSFFQKYLVSSFPQGVQRYEFRTKQPDWRSDCVTVTVTVTNGSSYVRRGEKEDDYQRVYHNHSMIAYHCEHCQYQAVPRYGDITIGDFWWVNDKDPEIDTIPGVSVVLCNNDKGRKFFLNLPAEASRVKKEVPLDWLGGNGNAIHGSHNWAGPKRDLFYKVVNEMDFRSAVDYALKPNHGRYLVGKGATPLFFQSGALHFRFEPEFWEESYFRGMTILAVKTNQNSSGHNATLSLNRPLEKGREYLLKARFRVRSAAGVLDFHVMDSGNGMIQVIYTHNLSNLNGEWTVIEHTFVPDSYIYDEIMFTSSQLSGEDNCLVLDYLVITEA